jgi:hypothetical protein
MADPDHPILEKREHVSQTSIQESFAQISINDVPLTVELAITPVKRQIGVMGRSTLPEGTGMLFVFDRPQNLSFWMKNTKIPLSIGFFDEQGRLISIENMDPPNGSEELPVYKSKKIAKYALEVPQGWFERHQIRPSMRFVWRSSAMD